MTDSTASDGRAASRDATLDPASALTETAATAAHPRLHDWYGEQRLRSNLAAALAEPVSWIDDETFGAGYRDDVAVIDVPDPLAWANRLLALPDGEWAVTGIRFRGRDLAKPFVEFIGSSLRLPDADAASSDAWQEAADEIRSAYSPFGPGKLQLFAAHPDRAIDAFTRLGWHAEVDMHLVAGQIADLRTRPRSARFADVKLTPLSPDRAAEFAETTYGVLASSTPASALWAAPQTRDGFAAYADDGLLFGVEHESRLAGVVAATRRDAHGMTGFSVEEIVLDADHRGRRLAGAVLQHLLEHLPATDGDVLWGTIHPDNHASLRNALGVGREIVGANLWVTPPGWPEWNVGS